MGNKFVTRVCPGCNEKKLYREDQKTCGCQGKSGARLQEQDTITSDKRVITLPRTRIQTLEELIKQFEIDTTKWLCKEFTANKWEMGYIAKSIRLEQNSNKETVTDNTAGHEPLFQVKAIFIPVITEVQNDNYVKENVRLQKENKRVKLQLAAEKRYREQMTASTAGTEEAMAQIRDLAQELGQFKLPTTAITHYSQPISKLPINPNHSEDAVFLLSDTHFGDVIRPGDTSGFPEYDLPISGNRMGYVIEKVRQILTMHRAMYPIKKLYIWLGGDMGNGDLHDAPVSNALFIGPQVDFTFKMVKFALEDLLALTVPDPITGVRVVEEIVLLFTCGNHMREATAKYMPMKYQSQRTFDWLIYQMLITWFKDTPRVTVREAMSPYIFEEIRGHRHLFAHGMQVGYKNSPDSQAKSMDAFLKTVRSLFDSPEFRRKNGLDGATFAKACIGDIHVPVSFPRLKLNGSLNGQNELGVNWGLEPIPAGQQLFGVTERHLQTFEYFVECTHVQKTATDWNSYGEWALEYEKQFGRK